MSEEEKENLKLFLKTGLAILTCIIVLVSAIVYLPKILPTAAGTQNVQAKKLPIYCVETEEKKIAISFDAAWGNEDTAKILEILKENDVRATFFMTGGWMEKYPDDVKAIYEAGHDLGNHSENHKQMSKLSAAQCKEELQKPHEKIKELTGVEMTLFRPPYGDYNDTVIEAANEVGYHVIQWDVDTSQTMLNGELQETAIFFVERMDKRGSRRRKKIINGRRKRHEVKRLNQQILRSELREHRRTVR